MNMTAARAYRASAEGAARLAKHPLLELCDPIKNPQFNAVNPLGRPMHSL